MAAGVTQPGLRFQDKVVIVTGGSRGIGKGVAEVFVQQGAKVVFCSNKEAEGRDTETWLNAQGPGHATFTLCELTDETQIKHLVESAVTSHGRLDCLVNNAGAHPPHLTIDAVSGDDLRHLMDVNAVAYFLTCKYALPHLRKTKGSIVNVGSLVTHIGEDKSVIYAATKGAVTAMSKNLAIDEAKYGVRVNTVVPGNIWTPLWEEVALTWPDPHTMIKEGKDQQLLGVFGAPRDVGLAVLYLAADATFCTGTELLVTGGAELNFAIKSRVTGDQ